MKGICYLCGTSGEMTDDHIPPKGLFPKPRPLDTVTVKCCPHCHKATSKDDEAFLAYVSTTGRNQAGRETFKKLLRGSWQMKRVKASMRVRHYNVAGLRVPLPTVEVDREIFDRVLIRMTKGFLAKHHPDYKYQADRFTCGYIPPIQEQLDKYVGAFQMLPRRCIGKDTFDYWGGITVERNGGCWAYLFYQSAMFMVTHADPNAPFFRDDTN